MNVRFIRISALLSALIFICQLAPVWAQKTTPIQEGSQTGTQTVNTSTDTNGNTITTTTTDLSGPLSGPNVQQGAVRETNHDTTEVTTDGAGHEIDRTETHVHENLDKDGNVIGRTTRTWKEHTDWKTGKRTYTGHTVTYNKNTGETTTDDFTSEYTYFGAGGNGHWEETGGHQEVSVEKNGQKKKTLERDYDWLDKVWKNKTISMLPTIPQSGVGGTTELVFAPSAAGPSSEIVATVADPTQSGPSDEVTVQIDDKKGKHNFFRVFTDPDGHFNFRLPAYAAAFEVFTRLTHDGKAEDAARCIVDSNPTVPATDLLPNPPATGPAITRGSSAYEPGANNTIDLQTHGTDPLRTHVLMDGSQNNVDTVAASNVETRARLSDDTPLGRHTFAVQSGKAKSNEMPADVVRLRADPIGVSETGAVQTVTVHCDGLPDSDSGTMYFQVGGAAQLADGGNTTAVQVKGGVAQVRIRGVHSGAALVRFKLHALIPGFWS